MLFSLALPLLLQAFPQKVLEVERLADGSTLVVDGGPKDQVRGLVFQVSGDGELLHAWQTPGSYTHAAELLSDGRILVADTQANRMLVLRNDGSIAWNSDDVLPLSDGTDFDYLNDVDVLANGNLLVCDCFHHRVLEVDLQGNVLWQFGEFDVAGGDLTHLNFPHNPQRLANGNTLIADYGNDRVVEVDPSGTMVWGYGPRQGPGQLDKPRDADLTPLGNIVIADSHNHRALIVARDGTIVRDQPHNNFVYDVDALASGNLLIGGMTATEYDSLGQIAWSWPPVTDTLVRQLNVNHPVSGTSIPAVLHGPRAASASQPVPCVVLVPGPDTRQIDLDSNALRWSQMGWGAVWFDLSCTTGATNDMGGILDQTGLNAVLQKLVTRPEVDSDRLVVVAMDYGMTLATGTLARWPNQPPVALLVDLNGLANRWESSSQFGGPIPRDSSNTTFWEEREAEAYLPFIPSAYFRVESQTHRNRPRPPQSDPLANVRGALRVSLGGEGISPHVLFQGELDHPVDVLPGGTAPLLSDVLIGFPYIGFRLHREIQRFLDRPKLEVRAFPAQAELTAALSAGTPLAQAYYFVGFSLNAGASPLATGGWLSVSVDGLFMSSLRQGKLDAAGMANLAWSVPPFGSGQTVYSQALVLDPGGFVTTRVSSLQITNLR